MGKVSRIKCVITVVLWLIAFVCAATFLFYSEKPFNIGDISDPKSESAIAEKIMSEQLAYGGSHIYILFKSDRYQVHDPKFKSEVENTLNTLRDFTLPHRVGSPYQNSHQIADNHHAAYAVISFKDSSDRVANSMNDFRQLLKHPQHLQMYVGGQPVYIVDVDRLSEINLIRGEMVALPLCIIALLFIFRGVVAALLPLISGILSITLILAILYILGQSLHLSIFVVNIATMLGLGLTLDYTLLITYRFREELHHNHHCKDAITKTLNTAGKTVIFSGLTVLLSMGFLLLFPINVLFSIGVGGVIVVTVAILSALTFLPAMLCLLEEKINMWPIHLWELNISRKGAEKSLWFRTVMVVMKYPLLFFIPTILFLLLLGYPFLQVKLTRSDVSILPTWTESHQLYDQFSKNFNVNKLTPIQVLFESKNKSILISNDIGQLYEFAEFLKKNDRVKNVYSIVSNSGLTKKQYQTLYSQTKHLDSTHKNILDETTKGRYTVMSVISQYPDTSEKSFGLVDTIRKHPNSNTISHKVGGSSAEIMDTIQCAYQLFFKTIIAISIITYFVLLLLLRSIILPIKAILLNFLSLSVCYGMLVFIFQEGHLANFLHFKAQGYTDLNLPILLFFGLFGLSMDYEVFLLSRIREFYEQTKDNTLSVALGLERSGRIITSAALIVVIVAGAYVTADIIFIKAFGLGTALAVAVDASIIRILLVPATMRLMGDWNWYLPKWLDRLLPNIEFD